jgi:hypothetical protein
MHGRAQPSKRQCRRVAEDKRVNAIFEESASTAIAITIASPPATAQVGGLCSSGSNCGQRLHSDKNESLAMAISMTTWSHGNQRLLQPHANRHRNKSVKRSVAVCSINRRRLRCRQGSRQFLWRTTSQQVRMHGSGLQIAMHHQAQSRKHIGRPDYWSF